MKGRKQVPTLWFVRWLIARIEAGLEPDEDYP